MIDKEIVERAKEAEKRTGFGELVHSPISKGVNSAFGIGFIEGMVEYRKSLQEDPASSIWHDASEPPIIDKTFLLVAPNGNSSLCLWGGKQLHSVTIGGGHSVLCKGDIYSYIDDLLNLDNSCNFGKNLQEEPASIDFEQELYKAFGQVKDFTLGMRIAKWFYDMGKNSQEPVSEDLEEACEQLAENARKHKAETSSPFFSQTDYRQGVMDGAKWQKEKDDEEKVLIYKHGFEDCKEQMMAKAVDGKVIANGMGNPILHLWDKGRHLIGKKVKVIVIKED